MKKLLCLALASLMLFGVSALAETTVTIPVISLDGDCLIDYTNWNDNSTYYPATLTFTDGDETFTKEIEIRPQGTTSLHAPKKNFTIKFSEGVEFVSSWGQQKKFVLKADYVDPTSSSNVGSARLAAEMNKQYGVLVDTPNYGVIDGFPVFVKINGEDAGVFNMTIPKNAWLFGMDDENPNHMVLACEGWSPASRMQTADIDYEADWAFEVGEANEISTAAFERMVNFVATADDATFVRDFEQYLDLDACLNYICFINVAHGNDNVAKNMLMVTYDGKVWIPALYDLDSLWGIGFDGTATSQTDGQWSPILLSDGNQLLYRVTRLFGPQLRARYQELRESILSKDHIIETFEAYAAQIPQEYYDINYQLWYADGTRIRTTELMSQLMDEYLPLIDSYMKATELTDVVIPEQFLSTAKGPGIHYVWEKGSMLQASENVSDLPVTMSLTYTLDGAPITEQDLAGKSGHLEATLRVERKADADHVFGIAALLHTDETQCQNITVTGGTLTNQAHENVFMGTAWLGGTENVYEMHLSMDVTTFEPAKYMVSANPVYIDGGHDNSLDALLATAGELMAIIEDGMSLHESMTQWHTYLASIQDTLSATISSIQPDAETDEESADSILKALLADAELAADTLLTELGVEVAAEATTADRVQLLSDVIADAKRTEEDKARATKQLELIEDYMAVAGHVETTQQQMNELNESITSINDIFPDLASAYAYANDSLYAIVYRISTLYQNLANYFAANNYGGGFDFAAYGDWYQVIVFSNHNGITAP